MSVAEILLRFNRRVARADDPASVVRLLARASIDDAGADAAAVLCSDADGHAEVVASIGLPPEVAASPFESAMLGPGLASELLARADGRFADARVVPLAADDDVLGVLVIACARDRFAADERDAVARGLAELGAIALRRSYDDLHASREALARAEELRALSQLAAGVSHDLKNLLNPLGLLVQLLRRRIERKQDALAIVDQLETALQSGLETVEKLRGLWLHASGGPDRSDGA